MELVRRFDHSGSVATLAGPVPALIAASGGAAAYAWEECFGAQLGNAQTRKTYLQAVRAFLGWCEQQGALLLGITPGLVGRYFAEHSGSPSTKKKHLAAIRKLFDALVLRHAIPINPAASVRLPRYQVVEGKTPGISVEQARTLLRSIDTDDAVGLRDRALIGILIYTAARVGAVIKLRLRDFQHDGSQWSLRFDEKGGKSRDIPVRHDLQQWLLAYLEATGLTEQPKDRPLFRSAPGKTKQLGVNPLTGIDACRMLKRRLEAAKLPRRFSPHSFRVGTITDLLEQGVPLEDVQYLAGHSDARTTRLYDRRHKQVTRNIVERISV